MNEPNQGDSNGIKRRTALRSGITGALVIGGLSSITGTVVAETLVVDEKGNADYNTINNAIDDAMPGDAVVVRPGTYAEDVAVDEPNITLTGKGDAVVKGSGSSQAAISIEADDVTVKGLRVRNPGGLLGIKSQPGNSGVTIRNNRVSNVGPFGRLGVSGIISGADQSGLAIVGNSVSGLRETAEWVAAQGIFLDDQGDGNADARIASNDVSDITSDNGGAIGILIQVSGATVTNNRVQGLNGRYAQGINYDVSGAVDGRAELNTFDNITGSQFDGEAVKIDSGDLSSLTVTQNNLLPPVGINNAVSQRVSAECNYWDSPSGPEPAGSGSEVMGDVDFEPWSIGRIGSGNAKTCRGGQ